MAVPNSALPRSAKAGTELVTGEKTNAAGQPLLQRLAAVAPRVLPGLALGLAGVYIISIVAQKWSWWMMVPGTLPTTVGDISTLFAPLLAIAIAIERMLETAFDWYEQRVRSVADVLQKRGDAALDWIEKEYRAAYEAVTQAATAYAANPQQAASTQAANAASGNAAGAAPSSWDVLTAARAQLNEAEQHLHAWVEAPEYKSLKRSISIWIGLAAGVIIAFSVDDLRMLQLLGLHTPRVFDALLTGLAIGAGSGPMHQLIGILQHSKGVLESLAKDIGISQGSK